MKHQYTHQKIRGQKRYFEDLENRELYNLKPLIRMYHDEGWSYEKIRVDHFGYRTLRARREHLLCLIKNYYNLNEELTKMNLSFQAWIWLEEFSGYEDCIVIHSKNKFTTFPHHYSKEIAQGKNSNLTDPVLIECLNQTIQQNEFDIRFGKFTTEESTLLSKCCILQGSKCTNSVFDNQNSS